MTNERLAELLEATDSVSEYIKEHLHDTVENNLLYTGVIDDTSDENYATINTVKKMVLTKLLKELEL